MLRFVIRSSTITMSDMPCNAFPRLPLCGAIAASVGAPVVTVKLFGNTALPLPGPLLLTLTSRAPVVALALIVIFAVSCVLLLIVVLLMPA